MWTCIERSEIQVTLFDVFCDTKNGREQVIQLESPTIVAATLFNATVLPSFNMSTLSPSSSRRNRGSFFTSKVIK